MLADIIVDMGAPGRGAPAAMRWMADWLPDADRAVLTRDDLARIDAYSGEARDLHELLAALPPLTRPVWYETTVTATGGTEMVMGYGAVPMECGIDVGWACYAPEHGRMIGPLGPARVTTTDMQRPEDVTDASWRELRSAAGMVLRALLLGIGR